MTRMTKLSAMLECRNVGKDLQRYLDGQTDEATARRIARHLDACRRCGFEEQTYRELKSSLARGTPRVDELAVARLRIFAAELVGSPPATGHDPF